MGSSSRLGEVAISDDAIWWSEGRPSEAGRTQIVRRSPNGELAEVLPTGTSALTMRRRVASASAALTAALAVAQPRLEGRARTQRHTDVLAGRGRRQPDHAVADIAQRELGLPGETHADAVGLRIGHQDLARRIVGIDQADPAIGGAGLPAGRLQPLEAPGLVLVGHFPALQRAVGLAHEHRFGRDVAHHLHDRRA